MARFDTADVRSYYERHTAAFVRFGQGGGTLHRAVWGPGVGDRQRAFRYIDDRIASLIDGLGPSPHPRHVVDLGCGVGASLCYLAERLPIQATGITLSPAQIDMARARIASAGLSVRVTCLEGDYCDLPSAIPPADAAYAVESFVHGASPQRFFAECARLIKPGGLLVICDDVRRPATSAAAARAIEEFVEGWHINALLEREALQALAAASGFAHVSTIDLTPWLEIRRGRDRMIAALVTVLGWLRVDPGRIDHVAGGRALQTCLARGWVGYEMAVFRRAPFGCDAS